MIGRLLARNSFQLVRDTVSVLSTESAGVFSVLKKPAAISNPSLTYCIRGSHHNAGPKVQQPAPPFEGTAVCNGDFKVIGLNDFKGKYLVLFFYPLDFTFVCPTEIVAFSDRIDEFKAINTAVVGVSCDSHFSHLAWINTPRKYGGLGQLSYPLLSDFNKTIAKDYDVLLEADGVPLRGLFIIDPQSVVRQITVNDLPVGRSVDEILRLVKAFQFTDKHGEVECVRPADGIEHKNTKKKFSVQNIKLKTTSQRGELPVSNESEETRDLSLAQLERAVLLDQLKFYRMQLKDLESKTVETKKQEKSTVNILEERDCISV